VSLLDNSNIEKARILSNIISYKFAGFGGDVVSDPSRTTTIIGKYLEGQPNGTHALIQSGLTESVTGSVKTTFNVLNDPFFAGWDTNRAWLDDAISRDDVIRVISDPQNADGFFKQEIEYLKTKGYIQSGAYFVKK
jgi:hypothetical protein